MILVLGGTGFVGRHVCAALQRHGLEYRSIAKSTGVDLENADETDAVFSEVRPDKVINCASFVGGIQFGYKHPVDIFEKNLKMTVNILRAAHTHGVKRLVNPISNCAYPAKARLFKEDEFWDGPLHESVLVYGFVRKAFWVGSWAYAREHGLDVVNLIVSNMYGPDDHFEEERSHALGALVMKFVEAKRNGLPHVTVWGTGEPVREWLYVEDGAEALVRGLDCPSHLDPVNIGVADGISIADLAQRIKVAVGYEGEIVYDTSKPDGAPYKTVDGTRGAELLGWSPGITVDAGIQRTVDWYLSNR